MAGSKLRGEYCFVEGKNGSRPNVAGFRSQENLIQINRSSAARSPAALPESFVPRVVNLMAASRPEVWATVVKRVGLFTALR